MAYGWGACLLAPPQEVSIQIRYLGTAGWYLAGRILIDPYLSRPPAWRVLRGAPLVPDENAIRRYTDRYNLRAEAILITHPHFDHLLDVTAVAALTGARVYAGAQAADLLRVCGARDVQVIQVREAFTVAGATVEVYGTPHRTILGRVPYIGGLREGLRPPLPARDYRMAEQFSFLVQMDTVRVLIASGTHGEPPTPADVLISGPDMPAAQLRPLLKAVRPHTVIANHWDDYFQPFGRPIRPSRMLRNPLRRIDVDAWRDLITTQRPGTRVVVPGHFEVVEV